MDPVSKFGEFVVTNLRDAAVDKADGILANRWKSPGLKSLQREIADLSAEQRELIRRVVVKAIDGGVHDFLFALSELSEEVRVLVDGHEVAKLSDGLHGESFSADGWNARFSKYGEALEQA